MKDNSLVEHNKKMFDRCLDISRAKSHDYAGDEDPMANFRMCERMGISSMADGILIRITDKISRLATLSHSDRKVVDESVRDTVMDIINYAATYDFAIQEKVTQQKD